MPPKKRGSGVRHAEVPDQAVNVDLCFVPATHSVTELIPAVSGSSGRLIVSQPHGAAEERDWPGRVFERTDLSYQEVMDQFIAAREAARAKPVPGAAEPGAATSEVSAQADGGVQAVRRELRLEEQRLRHARGQERARRRLIDQAWKGRQQEQRARLAALQGPGAGRARERGRARAAVAAHQRAEWAERHRELERRRQEDARWREARERLCQRQQEVGIGQVMAWIAILVIVDNCTRRCLGLPLFAMGVHVTAELVAEALRTLLPQTLWYLISDGGSHFTAEVLKDLANGQGFVRVPLARHRPQSNGIAERFVETLKVWLANKEWQTADELQPLLAEFRTYYNDRPHQGRELAGLSPNEYTCRLAVA